MNKSFFLKSRVKCKKLGGGGGGDCSDVALYRYEKVQTCMLRPEIDTSKSNKPT